MAYKTLNLDLAKSPILKPIIYGRIGDSDMQTVTVNITSRDVPVDLTGYTLTFEGITNGEKTKVFDVDGISSTPEGLKKGTFDYTFPNMAFAVGGSYEIAYFSIVKGDKRDTTGEFDIIVTSNADIDAEQAETIITEYNKLVQELHEITDKYISDSDAKFADINKKISDLQTKITQYQKTVKDTADGAIKAVDDALKKFEAGDFYTKSETDAKFKLTINDSGAIAAGTDLNSLNIPGFYVISARKPDTEITNYPPDVSLNSAGAMYAQIIVYKNASSGMILQHFLDNVSGNMYMRKYYSNSWSIWKKIAIDSEVVHLTGDETIAGKKTFTDEISFKGDVSETAINNFTSDFKAYSGQEPYFYRENGVVHVEGAMSPTKTLAAGATTAYLAFTLPEGCRPKITVQQLSQGSGDRIWSMSVNPDGTVTAGRYRTGATQQDMTVSNWLPFCISFKAAD